MGLLKKALDDEDSLDNWDLTIHISISRQRVVEQGDLSGLCEELLGEVHFDEVLGLIDENIPRKLGGSDLQFTELFWDEMAED